MPRHMIYIDGSIAQSVPEHPRRDNIFSISSAYGDAYLFQVCCPNCHAWFGLSNCLSYVILNSLYDELLKGIYKCMLVPLGHSKARNAAIKFVQLSAKKYSSVTAKHFLDAAKDFCGKQPVSR